MEAPLEDDDRCKYPRSSCTHTDWVCMVGSLPEKPLLCHGGNSLLLGYQQKNQFCDLQVLKPGIVTCHKSTVTGEKNAFFSTFKAIFSLAYGLRNKKYKYVPFTVDLHW